MINNQSYKNTKEMRFIPVLFAALVISTNCSQSGKADDFLFDNTVKYFKIPGTINSKTLVKPLISAYEIQSPYAEYNTLYNTIQENNI